MRRYRVGSWVYYDLACGYIIALHAGDRSGLEIYIWELSEHYWFFKAIKIVDIVSKIV